MVSILEHLLNSYLKLILGPIFNEDIIFVTERNQTIFTTVHKQFKPVGPINSYKNDKTHLILIKINLIPTFDGPD